MPTRVGHRAPSAPGRLAAVGTQECTGCRRRAALTAPWRARCSCSRRSSSSSWCSSDLLWPPTTRGRAAAPTPASSRSLWRARWPTPRPSSRRSRAPTRALCCSRMPSRCARTPASTSSSSCASTASATPTPGPSSSAATSPDTWGTHPRAFRSPRSTPARSGPRSARSCRSARASRSSRSSPSASPSPTSNARSGARSRRSRSRAPRSWRSAGPGYSSSRGACAGRPTG